MGWLQTNWHLLFLGLALLLGGLAVYWHWFGGPVRHSAPPPPDISRPPQPTLTVAPLKTLPTMVEIAPQTRRRSMTLQQALQKNRAVATLIVQRSAADATAQQEVALTKLPFTLGRADCDLTIKEPSISRTHAKIVQHGGRFYLIDLQSSNFTFVAGQKVPPGVLTRLRPNETILLGRKTVLRFEV